MVVRKDDDRLIIGGQSQVSGLSLRSQPTTSYILRTMPNADAICNAHDARCPMPCLGSGRSVGGRAGGSIERGGRDGGSEKSHMKITRLIDKKLRPNVFVEARRRIPQTPSRRVLSSVNFFLSP